MMLQPLRSGDVLVRALLMATMLSTVACTGYSDLADSERPASFELISESYIRGPGDTIGSGGRGSPGTTVCTYLNRDTGQRDVRRHPGSMPCPPFN